MENKQFKKYYLFSALGVIIASVYPLYMGIRVVIDMLRFDAVAKENYPKYIIPYTPISIAVLIGVLLMPLCIKRFKNFSLPAGSLIATAVFFITELLFEKKIVVATADAIVELKDWQMFSCYYNPAYPEAYLKDKGQTPIEILMGEYNPLFKLHFYIISVILILTMLSCIYGFGRIALSGDKKRIKPLIMQSVSTALFLGLCILACFTAFWRDGSVEVAPVSAMLMTVFFTLFGVVGGIYIGAFLLNRSKIISIGISAATASALTLVMYIGEMILLDGNLYILGNGFLFKSLPFIVLSVFDVAVIILSGLITAAIFKKLNK